MKKFVFAIVVLALGLATAPAFAQAPVNIVYPIDGGVYPITGPAPGVLSSAYFTSSFSVTCQGGPHSVDWGFDVTTVGTATFYDQFTSQFVHKLPGGTHIFWVQSDCGDSRVKFDIGN
ncbi:MAG TPA: hypothetical protein VGX68_15840 [Thermoanaerobaculia bacterium]|jgi:hypothetical protein|nr:hypothetical protein [Thermoanaerobaculia bacterium]